MLTLPENGAKLARHTFFVGAKLAHNNFPQTVRFFYSPEIIEKNVWHRKCLIKGQDDE